jgi:hypothetical protein
MLGVRRPTVTLDLIVWYDGSGSAQGFRLCYDKGHNEQAVLWSVNGGLSSATVDDGEGDLSRHKGSPILRIHPEMNADLPELPSYSIVHVAICRTRSSIW